MNTGQSAEKLAGRVDLLKPHNFVIFKYISTKLGDKVLFNSCVEFRAKIFRHCLNNKVVVAYFRSLP